MDIAQYISDLLKDHDEVELPGIGTFFKRSVSAYFNPTESAYYPPSHKIDFKQNEGSSTVLIDHIIQSKHISESSATYFIERFCENIKKNLDKDSSANISPLGTLLKSNEGYNLESGATSSGTEFFGLRPIKEPEILSKARVAIINDEDTDGVLSEESSSGSKWIWITLSIVLLLTAIAALAYIYYPQYFKNLNLSPNKKPNSKVVKPVIVPVKDSVSFADSIVNELEKQGLNAEVEKARDTVKISSNSTTPDSLNIKPKPARVYEIIVSSSNIKREAQSYVRSLRNKGIDAKVVVDTRKPIFKVSVGSFTSKSAANKENRRIRQELNKEAWILTITNKEN